jgi:nucleoside-diphosphate-sugar epimerase
MGGITMAERVLVTGGGGFLGKALIRELLKRGFAVQTLNRNAYPEVEKLGVRCFQGDLADYAAVKKAAEGCSIIFHVGAKAGIWGPYNEFYQANVVGTQNIIRVCRELDISKLIYTSSPSVTFAGQDQEGVDETTPYPAEYNAAYPATKAEAERAVLAANGPSLATVALRPHLIWGPGDQQLLPRLIERARRGRLRIVGSGLKKVDAIFIDNAVTAHICALERLKPGATISGKAYFISNAEPWPIVDIINGLLQSAALEPIRRHIPAFLAYRIGALLEIVYGLFRIRNEPPLTRFVSQQLATSHWYEQKAAREELGYVPRISMREGLQILAESLKKAP